MKRVIHSLNLLLVIALGLWSAAEGPAASAKGQERARVVSPPASCTLPRFGPYTLYAAGTNPYSIAVSDFNRDSKPDLVTANWDSGDVSVLLGSGTGSFGMATNFPTGSPRAVAVGDVNKDGNPDIAVANGGASVLLGDGTGNFGPATHYAGDTTLALVVADFTSDTNLDLAVGTGGDISVYPGDGIGGFGAAITSTVGMIPWGMASGDLNSDGKLDLVTASLNFDKVSVLLGNGDGRFGSITNLTIVDGPDAVALGDLNRDGKLDLAVANYFSNNVAVLLGNGIGGFGAATYIGMGNIPFSVALGDFNNDGKLDLATANQGSNAGTNNVSVALGKGNGRFGTATNFGTQAAPVSIAVGDFNMDGSSDLATANRLYGPTGSQGVSVLLNTCR